MLLFVLPLHMCGEMVDFGVSDKMKEISVNMDKSDTYNEFSSNVTFFIQKISPE